MVYDSIFPGDKQLFYEKCDLCLSCFGSVVYFEGKNYLTLELLNRMPATLVARIEAAVSNYILEVGKNKNVEEIKKN